MSDAVPLKPIIEAIERELLTEWKAGDEKIQPLSRVWKIDDFLKMFIETKRQTIQFDVADKILCLLQVQFLWWSDLRDIYYGVELSDEKVVRGRIIPKGYKRCEAAGCSNIFKEKKPNRYVQRFCCTQCQKNEWLRKNKYQRTLKQKRYDTCPNGHDRSSENVYRPPDGTTQCRICNRERRKRHREKKRAA